VNMYVLGYCVCICVDIQQQQCINTHRDATATHSAGLLANGDGAALHHYHVTGPVCKCGLVFVISVAV
jgi:hypothetical protein